MTHVHHPVEPTDPAFGPASVYTRYVLKHARVAAGCGGLRQLTHPGELARARRHAGLWNAATVVPYHVCDEFPGHYCAAPPPSPTTPGGTSPPDITLWHTGSYTVHTLRGSMALRALANEPLHMPVEGAILALGDLGVAIVVRPPRPGMPPPSTRRRRDRGLRNLKVWAPDVTIGTVFRFLLLLLCLLTLTKAIR